MIACHRFEDQEEFWRTSQGWFDDVISSCISTDLTSIEFAAVTSQVLYAHHLPNEHILLTPDLYGKLPSVHTPILGLMIQQHMIFIYVN